MFYQHLFLLIVFGGALIFGLCYLYYIQQILNHALHDAEGKGYYFTTLHDFFEWVETADIFYKGKSHKGADILTKNSVNSVAMIVAAIGVLYHLIYLLP